MHWPNLSASLLESIVIVLNHSFRQELNPEFWRATPVYLRGAVMAILLVNDVFLPVGFWLALLTIPLLVTAVESLVTTYMGRSVSLSGVSLWEHLYSRGLQTDSLVISVLE